MARNRNPILHQADDDKSDRIRPRARITYEDACHCGQEYECCRQIRNRDISPVAMKRGQTFLEGHGRDNSMGQLSRSSGYTGFRRTKSMWQVRKNAASKIAIGMAARISSGYMGS